MLIISSQTCPDLWRQCLMTTSPGIVKVKEPSEHRKDRVNYCYNCGHKGHLGYVRMAQYFFLMIYEML